PLAEGLSRSGSGEARWARLAGGGHQKAHFGVEPFHDAMTHLSFISAAEMEIVHGDRRHAVVDAHLHVQHDLASKYDFRLVADSGARTEGEPVASHLLVIHDESHRDPCAFETLKRRTRRRCEVARVYGGSGGHFWRPAVGRDATRDTGWPQR